MCGSCHDINRLKAGYTPEGWRTVMRMMHNMDVPVPADQVAMVTEYLIKSFPERPRPAAAVIDGPAKAEIRMFAVTTPGSRPHDPLAAKDGAIWYTGQLANKLGVPHLVKPGRGSDYPSPEPRPRDLTLADTRMSSLLPDWSVRPLTQHMEKWLT